MLVKAGPDFCADLHYYCVLTLDVWQMISLIEYLWIVVLVDVGIHCNVILKMMASQTNPYHVQYQSDTIRLKKSLCCRHIIVACYHALFRFGVIGFHKGFNLPIEMNNNPFREVRLLVTGYMTKWIWLALSSYALIQCGSVITWVYILQNTHNTHIVILVQEILVWYRKAACFIPQLNKLNKCLYFYSAYVVRAIAMGLMPLKKTWFLFPACPSCFSVLYEHIPKMFWGFCPNSFSSKQDVLV